jgi:hypothetical protein
LLGGGWLIAEPFVLGYQHADARWADATKVGVFTGSGILTLGFLTLACFTAALVAALRAEGALAPRRRAAPRGKPADGAKEPADLQMLVARLALVLVLVERNAGLGGAASQQPEHERRASL